MRSLRFPFFRVALAMLAATTVSPYALGAQVGPATGTTFDEAAPPGANYDKAEFRLWIPPNAGTLRAIVALVPGSNGDWRTMVDDTMWRAFAVRNHVALVGCRFTDKQHPEMAFEQYINVSQGSGQAFLNALDAFADHAKHPELAKAPLLLWGMSAGGQFNYEFVAWKPERVIAFVVNKGGVYYSALLSPAARAVPGLLFVGGKDLEFRTNTIVGLFAVNRRGSALWALTEEPGAAHAVARSRDLTVMFFDDVLPLRLGVSTPASGPVPLTPLAEKSGFLGDLKAKTFAPLGEGKVPGYPTAWLPTERVARAWQAVVTDKPFDP